MCFAVAKFSYLLCDISFLLFLVIWMQHTISSAQPDEVFKGTPVDEFSEQKSTIELEEKLHTIDVIEQAFVADDVDQTNGNGIMQRAQEWQSFISSVEKSFPVQVKRLADLPSSARINFGGLFISCALSIFWDSKMSTHVEESEIGSDFTLSLVDWITSATSVVIESVLCCAPQESVALRQILSMHMPPFQDTRPDSLPKTECFITFLSSPMNSGDNEAAFQTYLGVHPCLAPLPLVVYLRDCIVLLILHSSNDNRVYNARTREVMFLIAESFAMDSDAIRSFEITVGETLHSYENISSAEGRVSRSTKFAQRAKIVGATVGGGILLAVTAGLALPAIAAGVASLGIGLSSIGLGAVGSALVGTSIVMSSLGVGGAMIVFGGVGASLTGIKLSKRFGDLDIDGFKFRRLRKLGVDNRPDTSTDALEIVIGISGYITSSREFGEPWKCIRNRNSGLTDVYVLHWEKKNLLKLGSVVLKMVTTEVAGALTNAWLNFTLGAAAAPAVFPVMIVSSMSDLDNAWLVVRDRAYQAGEALAYSLTNEGVVGLRPVTLIGYSMGSVVIFACLQALADAGQFHRVQNVILMGAPIPATFAFESQRLPWKKAKSAVSGRFVNCHSSKDSLLGFLCRVVDWVGISSSRLECC